MAVSRVRLKGLSRRAFLKARRIAGMVLAWWMLGVLAAILLAWIVADLRDRGLGRQTFLARAVNSGGMTIMGFRAAGAFESPEVLGWSWQYRSGPLVTFAQSTVATREQFSSDTHFIRGQDSPPPVSGESYWEDAMLASRWQQPPEWAAADRLSALSWPQGTTFSSTGYGWPWPIMVSETVSMPATAALAAQMNEAATNARIPVPPIAPGQTIATSITDVRAPAWLSAITLGRGDRYAAPTTVLVGNSLKSGAVLALILAALWHAPGGIYRGTLGFRRWRRARRGLCPACAYDRRGLDAASACPECGSGARP